MMTVAVSRVVLSSTSAKPAADVATQVKGNEQTRSVAAAAERRSATDVFVA